MKVLTSELIKKYFSDFTVRYINNFYSHKGNKFAKLLCRDKYSNLKIDMYGICEYLHILVDQSVSDYLPKQMLKGMTKQYIKDLKNNTNITIAECEKGQISQTVVGKIIMMSKMNQIQEAFADTPLSHKLKTLYDNRTNFSQFEKEYENLLPYDRDQLLNYIKTDILPCYHDFYTSFVPLRIHRELETKKIKMLCHYQKLDNNNYFSVNIKIPENNNVSFHRGGRFKHTVTFGKKDVILEGGFETAPKFPPREVQYYNKKYYDKKYHRLISRISLIISQAQLTVDKNIKGITLNKPFNIHIFESKYNKIINWHDRIIANRKNNSKYVLSPEDQQMLHKFVGSLEINTGYSIIGPTSVNKIVIYRKEELDKILLHEFIHILRIDAGISDPRLVCIFKRHLKYDKFCNEYESCNYYEDYDSSNPSCEYHNKHKKCEKRNKYDQCIKNKCSYSDSHNEDSILRLTEGYTDFCADLINVFLYAVEIGAEENMNFREILDLYVDLLSIEINFALFQAAKLLLYFNFDSYNDLYKHAYICKKNTGKVYKTTIKNSINAYLGKRYFEDTSFDERGQGRKNNSTIRQTTCLFSYFIIRAILLLNMNTIFDELYKLNKKPKTFFDFLSTNNTHKAHIIKNIIAKSLISKPDNKFASDRVIDLYMEIIKHIKISKYDIDDDLSDYERLENVNDNEFSIDDTLAETMRRSIFEFK